MGDGATAYGVHVVFRKQLETWLALYIYAGDCNPNMLPKVELTFTSGMQSLIANRSCQPKAASAMCCKCQVSLCLCLCLFFFLAFLCDLSFLCLLIPLGLMDKLASLLHCCLLPGLWSLSVTSSAWSDACRIQSGQCGPKGFVPPELVSELSLSATQAWLAACASHKCL